MSLGQYALTLGAVPFFASRLFLTTFLLALFARLAQDGHLAFLDKLGPLKVDLAFDLPAWLTHPTTLYVLAVLAVLESLKEKNNGIREFFEWIDAPSKSLGSAVVKRSPPFVSSRQRQWGPACIRPAGRCSRWPWFGSPV